MKPPRHSSDEGGIVKEKVVVQYNEENVLTSQPSSLAENGDDEYYLTNKNIHNLRGIEKPKRTTC